MEEVFERLEGEMYEIWLEAFGEDVKQYFDTYATTYKKLQRYWANLHKMIIKFLMQDIIVYVNL